MKEFDRKKKRAEKIRFAEVMHKAIKELWIPFLIEEGKLKKQNKEK